jgi:hypothetical protein
LVLPAEGSNSEGGDRARELDMGLPWCGGGSLAAQSRAARRTAGARAPPFRGGRGLPPTPRQCRRRLGRHMRRRQRRRTGVGRGDDAMDGRRVSTGLAEWIRRRRGRGARARDLT